MSYTRTTWRTGETPLSAGNMNNIEDGIEECMVDQEVKDLFTALGWVEPSN